MSRYAVLGRGIVRHRWAVVFGWLIVLAVTMEFLPSIGDVIKNDNAAFLPANAPSVVAAHRVAPFVGSLQSVGTLVVVRADGPMTPSDQGILKGLEERARRVVGVSGIHDAGESLDGSARTALVDFSPATEGGGPIGAGAVAGVRAVASAALPAGLEAYLTGPLPELVDQQRAGNRTANHVQLLSAVFILLLLGIAFRSLLAPIITLAPALLALAVAGPLIATSTHLGVQISALLQLLLTALVLGAGTDYGLFLVFRYRENLRRGLDTDVAIVAAVEKVGASVSFSALTVIAALMSLVLASFGLYRGVGPGLAIGIVVVAAVELTLLPAVLSIAGRAAFWPAVPKPGQRLGGSWGAVARRVVRRPVTALAVGVALLGSLALALVSYAPSGFDPGGYIQGSDSQQGQQVLIRYFGASSVGGTDVVVTLPRPAWADPFQIQALADGFSAQSTLTSVTGPLDVDGAYIPPNALREAFATLGPPESLPAVQPAGDGLSPEFYNAYRSTATSISADGSTVLYRVSLRAGSPGSTAALQAIPKVRAQLAEVARALGAPYVGVAGQAASAADVSAISAEDIFHIAPVVLVVLFVLLAVVLRSLVAPIYLVASVALSFLASLGLAVGIFVILGHQLGVNFTLPFFLFVFIMALGEDYNILVMTRIKEEAERQPLRLAVAEALSTTGTTVTSAGLVLAGTFAVLAFSTHGQIRQIATGLALGILLDTFVVRTLLVPSAAVLVGRWNWWPSVGPR